MSHFSEMRMWPVESSTSKLRANGQVLVAGVVVVHFQVFEGREGRVFGSLPSRRGKDNEDGSPRYFQQVRIPSDNLYSEFQTLVEKTYKGLIGGQQEITKDPEPETTEDSEPYQDNVPF